MKKIVFLTGTRADFGKLKSLMSISQNSSGFEVHIADETDFPGYEVRPTDVSVLDEVQGRRRQSHSEQRRGHSSI